MATLRAIEEATVEVVDFEEQYEVADLVELESVLMKRYVDNTNEFHLCHAGGNYPDLAILVKGDLACLHYFAVEGHPGFQSVGDLSHPQAESISFPISKCGDYVEVMNSAVVPFSLALAAAKEFMILRRKPESVEWLEL